MGRIFTFGCSFTSYAWPTWADMILYKNEGYNLAVSGGGFDSILYRILEGDRKFKFTEDDKLIIMFTTPLRFDFLTDGWSTHGNVYNNKAFEKYENVIFNFSGLLFKSFYNIKLINDYLKYRNLNFIYSSINNLYEDINRYFIEDEKIFTIYHENKQLIKDISNEVKIDLLDMSSYVYGEDYDGGWELTKIFEDNRSEYHRRPLDHYNWIKDILMKKVDIDLKVTESDILKIEQEIDNMKKVKELETLYYKFPSFYQKRASLSIYINDFSFPK